MHPSNNRARSRVNSLIKTNGLALSETANCHWVVCLWTLIFMIVVGSSVCRGKMRRPQRICLKLKVQVCSVMLLGLCTFLASSSCVIRCVFGEHKIHVVLPVYIHYTTKVNRHSVMYSESLVLWQDKSQTNLYGLRLDLGRAVAVLILIFSVNSVIRPASFLFEKLHELPISNRIILSVSFIIISSRHWHWLHSFLVLIWKLLANWSCTCGSIGYAFSRLLTLYINVLYSTAYLNSSFCYGMRSVTS